MNEVTLSKAVEGYLLYAHSRRLSEYTIRDYQLSFRKFGEFLSPPDPPMTSITVDQVEDFLASLSHLSKKTVLNYHVGLSALWTWAVKRRIVDQHILRHIDAPKPEQTVITIFTEEEV